MTSKYLYEDQERSDFEFDLSSKHRGKNSIHSIPFYFGVVWVISLVVLFSCVYAIENLLPEPFYLKDEVDHPDSFITERAVHDLKMLTDMGPRVVGSYENEYLTVDFLNREIQFIMQTAHKSKTIELDNQVVSGSYYIEFKKTNIEYINSYINVQNVVVKLHGQNSSGHSVLVNSHFDSVPTSPGGSDDGINVAVMLEVLRKLSRSSDPLKHDIIFLFNGAEESPLQASHGFITQHKWAKECKVLINLEAAGAGGKIVLFQTGPESPWLMKYYNMVPHPYGQAAGEEIFQSGAIPSDTDFRIFRDYGGLVGYDMAFFKNGYRYHTKYDGFKNIPLGSYQHVGDNVLSLVKNLGTSVELFRDSIVEPGKVVYYDVFGWFMVSYSESVGFIINISTVVISFGIFFYSWMDFNIGFSKLSSKYALFTLGTILLGWIASGLSVYITATVLDICRKNMSWYGHPWLIFGLFVVPTIGFSGAFFGFANLELLSLNIRCQLQAHYVRLIWTIILFFGTIYGIRSMYAVMLPVLFNSLGFVIIYLLKWQRTVRKWQMVYLISLIPPTTFLMCQALTTLSLFIPITGRMGSNRNPDLLIGLMSCFFTIGITSPFVIFTNSLRGCKYYFAFLVGIFVIFFVLIFTPLGFPYSGDSDTPHPQRHWIMHTKRIFHNEKGEIEKSDSGVFFLNLDRNSPSSLHGHIKDLERSKSLSEDCQKYLLCGLPLSHGKMIQILEYSTWVPVSQPVIHEPVHLQLLLKEEVSPRITRYNMIAYGTDRMALYLRPKNKARLVNISFVNDIKFENSENKIYFILLTYGKDPAEFTFNFDVEVPENYNDTVLVDVAITAKYVHERKMVKTPYFLSLIKEFPPWADVTAWLGSYTSYVL